MLEYSNDVREILGSIPGSVFIKCKYLFRCFDPFYIMYNCIYITCLEPIVLVPIVVVLEQ